MTKKIKINMGCGWRVFKGWEHVDGGDYNHLDSMDIELGDYAYVDVIYASHFLEYFSREEAIRLLKIWYDKLIPGGKLYLSVPDFKKLSKMYNIESDVPLVRIIGPLYGEMDMDGNRVYHKIVYDFSSLGELLKFVGFSRIEPWTHDEIEKEFKELKGYDDHSKAKINGQLISLNVCCTKV